MSDRIFGMAALCLAALMAWGASVIEQSFIQDPLGPKAFPLIIAAVLAITGIIMMLKPDAEPDWPKRAGWLRLAGAIVALFLYAQLLPVAGFVLCTTVVAAFLSRQLGATWRQASIGGATIAIGIYVVFHLVLGLSLARGPLGF